MRRRTRREEWCSRAISIRRAAGSARRSLVFAGLLLVIVGCGPKSSGSSTDPTGGSKPTEATAEAARASFANRIRSAAPHREGPWVLAHALLAFGPELTVGNPPESVFTALERWSKPRTDGRGFDLQRVAGALGEQHSHLVLKTLTEVALDHAPAKPLIDDLVAAARLSIVIPKDREALDDCAWGLEAFCRIGGSPNEPIRPGGPTLRDIAFRALDGYEAADGVVERALAEPEFARPSGEVLGDESGVYGLTCGGQHLLQALITAVDRDVLVGAHRARVEARVGVLARRLAGEYRFRQNEYQRAVRSGANPAKAKEMFAVFSLKLLGHGLETLGRAQRAKLGNPAEVAEAIAFARERLAGIQRSLDEDIDPKRTLLLSLAKKPHLWELWFGDGCHALRGQQVTDPN
ncbi:MAG: hypothetical protein AAF488_07345 [Planctomycetota bacterium]